jgi:hypothetical protein
MYMYLRGVSRPFHNGSRLISDTIVVIEISNLTDKYFKAKIIRHGRKKNDKAETGNVLLYLICPYPSKT